MAAARSNATWILPSVLKRMIISGGKALQANKAYVDQLNVFPVPDGDTGTNMSLTMASAIRELNTGDVTTMRHLADKVSHGALSGARGNSGVILSQILKGFATSLASLEGVDTKRFAKALCSGAETAYSAVSKPQEGTILTVIRLTAEYATDCARTENDFEKFLNKIIQRSQEVLEMTPQLLPVLKSAGVVDSGGQGLVYIFKGLLAGYLDQEIVVDNESFGQASSSIKEDDHMEMLDYESLGELTFGYCTEFFIINMLKKTTLTDIDKLRDYLNEMGDSVICIGDLNLVKVHVHTNNPGKVIAKALTLGEVDKIKIDNMMEQNRQLRAQYEANRKPIGLLAVCAGEGFSAIFKDLLVDQVIEGGQTMNPSAEDIASAVRKINAENVIILPNNKNIVLAAEQCRSLVSKRNIYVVPTRNVPQGLNAVLNYNPEADVTENLEAMMSSLHTVTNGEVTYAVRDTDVDKLHISKGDIIGLDNKKILTSGKDVEEVTFNLIKKIKKSSHQVITLYYGKDVKADDAEAFCEKVQDAHPDCDVMLQFGGQPLYYYILALE